MNRVILMGRLTRDPEVRYSSGERSMAIARYTLAVDRRGRRNQGNDQQTADFIPCVAFDRAGEFAEKYFRQGMRVLVSGRIIPTEMDRRFIRLRSSWMIRNLPTARELPRRAATVTAHRAAVITAAAVITEAIPTAAETVTVENRNLRRRAPAQRDS